MTHTALMTYEFAHECFEYRSGRLIWKERPISHFPSRQYQRAFNSRHTGTNAGTVVNGYVRVNMLCGRMTAHRVVFLMHHRFIASEIDHIDGNTLNNNIDNLRATTHAQNLKNMKTPSSNTSGIKGVSWHRTTGKWTAGIRMSGKWKHLGLFTCISDAGKARKAAEIAIYGEFANER